GCWCCSASGVTCCCRNCVPNRSPSLSRPSKNQSPATPDGPRDFAGRAQGARSKKDARQRPTLPPGCPDSTIGAGGLNFRVRKGNGCLPSAMVTEPANYTE